MSPLPSPSLRASVSEAFAPIFMGRSTAIHIVAVTARITAFCMNGGSCDLSGGKSQWPRRGCGHALYKQIFSPSSEQISLGGVLQIHAGKELTLKTRALKSLYSSQITSSKFVSILLWRSTIVTLETNPLIHMVD